MKKRLFAALICGVCLFSGCSRYYNGSYSSVKPHVQPQTPVTAQTLSASNQQELQEQLEKLISSAKSEGVIYVDSYDQDRVHGDMQQICQRITQEYSIAAYALEGISYELGKSNGQSALSLMIRYAKSPAEILGIRTVSNMDVAADQIRNAMARCDVGLVLRVSDYEQQDYLQIVENYAMDNPQLVMELPQVSWKVYPEEGKDRVLELFFTYQTSRDALRSMQEKVEPFFASAVLYVSGDASHQEKFSQLYSFLMERYDYKYDTSITPAYSLLRHGVGDSRAFAMVYAAMCRQAELECIVVSGTKDGESHYWNIICRDEAYYHVDLLSGSYQEMQDEKMVGYVWDYSAYPACTDQPVARQPKK